jgi:hypothetical protein
MIDQLRDAFFLPFQMLAIAIAFFLGCAAVFTIASVILALPEWLRDWRRGR